MYRDEWLPLDLALETGLRIGDIVAIRKRDVVEESGKLWIYYTAAKTGKPGRAEVPARLGAAVRRKLRLAVWCEYLFPPGRRYTKTPHLTRQACWARLKRACRDAGIDPAGVSPHSLRKVFAVELLHDRGLAAVKEALQHSNDAVTRVYAYADTVGNPESDEPIRWRDLELIVDYILERIHEKNA